MSDDRVRFAVIGCGGIARMHVELLKANPRAEVLWAVDKNGAVASAFAREMGIPYISNLSFLALNKRETDAVLVATETEDHFRAVTGALRAHKHVFVDEPMAATIYDAEQMVRIADEMDRILMVDQHYRWDPVMVLAKEYLMGASLGKLLYARSACEMWMPLSGRRAEAEQCVMLEMGVHILDLLRWLTGRNIEEVTAYARRINAEVAGDTVAQALLLLEGDVPAVLTVSWASRGKHTPPHGVHHLVFEEGSVTVGEDVEVSFRDPGRAGDVPPHPPFHLDMHSLMASGMAGAQNHFIDCILDGCPPVTCGANNINTIRAVYAAYHSSQEGRMVKV
ncbi:MAG: Gfo/Idh/MocA family oxidoreductase [Armatimonadetes bacterium]|nr:Gfo/Idh/MocA family oxidoreductase [Armatimonadota bacterium]